jgi:hypothetical protein
MCTILNAQKYQICTTKIQNPVKNVLANSLVEELTNLHGGYSKKYVFRYIILLANFASQLRIQLFGYMELDHHQNMFANI